MLRLLCTDAVDQIEAYLDGELAPIDRRQLENHLGECSGCARELALARRVTRCLRGLPLLECPDDVIDAVSEELAREAAPPIEAAPSWWPGSRSRATALRSHWRPGLAIAAALVALAVGLGGVFRLDRLGFLPGAEPVYNAAQLTQAEEEARLALAYLGALTNRARTTLRDDVIVDRVVAPPLRALGSLGGSRDELE